MITKVLPATKNREINYDNKGSSERLVNYFEHEGKEQGQEAYYFSQDEDGLSKEEVVASIDGNVKGLKKDDTKFVSLVISPSSEELAHIKGDPEMLKKYTIDVMENYAKNFTLKNGNQLEGKDLVWYGIIHETRKYQWDDKEVKEGKAQKGESKGGVQTHIHIVVSTRDKEQKITLNPDTSKARFNIVDFQKKNAETFQQQFNYEKQTHFHKEKPHKERGHIDQVRYFEKRINRLAEKYDLDEKTVGSIRSKAAESGYSKEFYKGLKDYSTRINNKEGRKDDLTEFANLRKAEPRENREFAHSQAKQQRQAVQSQRVSYAVESVLRGAGDNKDDDREILKDLSNKRGGHFGL